MKKGHCEHVENACGFRTNENTWISSCREHAIDIFIYTDVAQHFIAYTNSLMKSLLSTLNEDIRRKNRNDDILL